MSEKEITLLYNNYEIKLNITNDYKSSMEAIKKKLYLQDEDLENLSFIFYDEDDDKVDIDEDEFDDAYKASKWELKKQEKEEETPQVDISDVKEKIQANAQKEINEKIKKIKEDLITKFTKITNEKISLNISKYEERIKKLEDIIKSLKEKNKDIIEKMKTAHDESVKAILNSISEYAGSKIENHFSQINDEFSKDFNTKVNNCNNETGNLIKNVKSTIDNIITQQDNMKESIKLSKEKFSEIYNLSTQNIK